MPVLLDTSLLPAGERAEALQTVLTGATAPHELRLLDPPERVHARLEHWQLSPDVALLHQHSSGVSHSRNARHARKDGPERVVFVLHDGGPGGYIHEDSAYPLLRGALYVTDLNFCYSYTRPGEGSARIVQVEQSALGLSMEQVRCAAVQLQASPLYAAAHRRLERRSRRAGGRTRRLGQTPLPAVVHAAADTDGDPPER